jgi:hypothetical protein
MMIAAVLRFIGALVLRLLIFFITVVILSVFGTFIASKIGPRVEKWLDNPWVEKYFVWTEKCVANLDQKCQRHAGWLEKP